MIPKNLLLAFLALQSSSNPRTSKENAASEVAIQLSVLIELETTFQGAEVGKKKSINGIDYLGTPPRVQTSGYDAQVPIKIPSGQKVVIQKGSREINFNNVPPGFSDPSKVSFPDGFQVLAQPHSYNLKDAFHSIKPPPAISRVWGAYPAGGHFEVSFSGARGTVTNVSIQFGWIENGALTPGSYTSQIWTLRFRGWDVVNGPSGSFNGLDWETTTNIVASGDRFVFDFSGGPSDKVLVVSTVFYDLPLGEGLRRA